MSLFRKVLIIGLATMALGTAAMGEDKPGPSKPDCTTISDLKAPASPAGPDGKPLVAPVDATATNANSR